MTYFKLPQVAHTLQSEFGSEYNFKDWSEENKNLFQVMKTERTRDVFHFVFDYINCCF